MLPHVGVLISVCLLSGTLLQVGAQGAPAELLDGGCPVGATLVSAQILRSHLVDVPPSEYAGSGSAVVDIQVDEIGSVCSVSLVSADAGLSEEVVAWVKRWRFSPFLLAGFPVQVTARIPVHFGQKRAMNPESQRKRDDLCDKGNLCLYLRPDGTLLRDGQIVTSGALRPALDGIDVYVLLRPDPRTAFAVVKKAHASLEEHTSRLVRFSAPYYKHGEQLVRLPGQFVDRDAVIQAAHRMGYQVMALELGVTFPEIGVKQFVGSFTVNLAGDVRAARRMQSLTYQGPPGTPARTWPEEWLYEFDVDGDGAVVFRAPKGDQPATELDKAVLKHSRTIVSPPPYPAPARVLLRLQLAR